MENIMKNNKQKISYLAMSLVTLLIFSGNLLAGDMSNTWHSFNDGLAKAEKEKKTVLVDFYADWCHWCKVMDEKTFQESAVAKKLQERFVTVKLNAEDRKATVNYMDQSYTNPQLTQAFGVTGFPSLAFLDNDGKVITLVPGYVEADMFLQILNYIDDRCWEKDVSFDDYVKNQDCSKAS